MPRADDPLRGVAPRLAALAEAEPEREVCGLVAGPPGVAEPWLLPNRAVDPRRAYALDPADVLVALHRLDVEGRVLLAVFHSHPEGGAELSRRDLDHALVDGSPLLGGVAQLVVALELGRAVRVRLHRWAGDRFLGEDLWTPVP